jgi:hypothetical protein
MWLLVIWQVPTFRGGTCCFHVLSERFVRKRQRAKEYERCRVSGNAGLEGGKRSRRWNVKTAKRQYAQYNKKFWEELITFFPLIRHGPHRKRYVQWFYCCIRCRGNVITEPLPSTDKGVYIQTHRLMGGIYEVRHDIHTKFNKDWFTNFEVDGGGVTDTHRQQRDLISLLYFFKLRKVG